ncbi:MAG: extracellular solute-binding protein [Lachnospiraceae bacterium]|nr:extracellular solute-binding protein [Lachnospiraceae bacterium]
MSKRKLQKALGLILSTAMIAGLAACGSENTQGTTASSETQQESVVESTTPTEPSEKEPEVVEITYPLDTDVTLKFWATNALKIRGPYETADASPFHSGLSRKTGVDLEWTFPQSGVSAVQAFNLLLTDEEMPHIIYYSPTPAEAETYIADGLIYDLTEYLPKYAPDYWAFINDEANTALRRAATTESGQHFMFAATVESDINVTYQGLAVRKDWLDACGLDIPTTLEDWETMLATFKEKYGATFSSPKAGYGVASAFGAYADKAATWYIDDNGQVTFANNTDEYKAFLETLHRWLEEGLMDPDITTNDATALRNKCLNNEVGAMFLPASALRNVLADAESAGNGAEWVGVPYPVAKEGAPTTWVQTRVSNGNGLGAMITTECSEEELILALNFLNYGYTEEGIMYWNFGEEGVTYTLDANGKPQWTELITKDEAGANTAYTYYVGTSSSGPTIQAEDQIVLINKGAAIEALRQFSSKASEAKKHCMPLVSLTEAEHLVYTDAWTAINTYVSENIASFINGDKSLDEWDAYKAELDKMGLKECRDVYQAAYERWLAK